MVLSVFGLPIYLMIILRISVLYLIIVIKSEVWPHLPLFRVRSWNSGMHCISFYILTDHCMSPIFSTNAPLRVQFYFRLPILQWTFEPNMLMATYKSVLSSKALKVYYTSVVIVRRAGLLWSQQDFEWRWSVPLFKCLTVLEFSFILFDLCLLITFFNFIMNYVPIVTFWIFTYHKIWILSIMFCFIWSYWIIYFLACLEVSWRVVS